MATAIPTVYLALNGAKEAPAEAHKGLRLPSGKSYGNELTVNPGFMYFKDAGAQLHGGVFL